MIVLKTNGQTNRLIDKQITEGENISTLAEVMTIMDIVEMGYRNDSSSNNNNNNNNNNNSLCVFKVSLRQNGCSEQCM